MALALPKLITIRKYKRISIVAKEKHSLIIANRIAVLLGLH
jgi:hypothetical protein